MNILVLNSGSSSIKFSVFEASERREPRSLFEGEASGFGTTKGKFSIKAADGNDLPDGLIDESPTLPDAAAAFKLIAEALRKPPFPHPDAIGHRMVSGGPTLTHHQRVTPQVLADLEKHAAFAPLHIPVATSIVHKAEEFFPGVSNFVCFDSVFHSSIPEVAARFAIPEKYWEQGVRRYGAHGLSNESIVYQLRDRLPRRMIVAHLGNGSSITALLDGKSLDTSMGLTPTGGIVSSTRTGDIDPGVLIYILRDLAASVASTNEAADAIEALTGRQSGLLGVSQLSNDMRALREAMKQGNEHAAMAVAQYVYVIRKFIGGYFALLGGLDALVFTGGIGENDGQTRVDVCAGLAHLGISLDPEFNQKPGQGSVSQAGVQIFVVPAEEDLMIAMHTFRLMQQS